MRGRKFNITRGALSVDNQHRPKFKGDGIITFQDVPIALKAEKVLKAAGIEYRLVAPPPKFRLGCALGVEIMLSRQQEILDLFQQKDVPVSQILPID
jgi:hypothetical protein